jgi:phosphoserine phosphatase RsbU/P
MAKFVFRSLAREHSDPEDFLASANEVVVGEISPAKFITMLYLTVDPRSGELACASAGHPPPRIVTAAGKVSALPAAGMALGIEPDQKYDEVRAQLEEGAAIVLYTDGLPETRRGDEQYGETRLDAILAATPGRTSAEIARAVVEDCRAFAGGDLGDDCAVVVIKRLP